jgi:hypothetical protein
MAFGASAGPGPIRWEVAEASAYGMEEEGRQKHRCAGYGRIREIHVVSPAPAQAGAPIKSPFLQARSHRPPQAGQALAVALGATTDP